MARGTSLSDLRQMLKAELGQTLTAGVATQADARYNVLLASMQRLMATEHDWPFLRHIWDITIPASTRYVAMTGTDIQGVSALLDYERPLQACTLFNRRYLDVDYGIDFIELNQRNTDLGLYMNPIRRFEFRDSIVVPTPDAVTVADSGEAGLPDGALNYKVTFVTAYGEGPLSAAAAVTVATNKVSVTAIPTGDNSYVSSRKIYRTKAGGSTYFLLTTLVNNTATTYTDNTADASLTVPYAAPATSVYVPIIEIWPVPTIDSSMRIYGQRTLRTLVSDSDAADLDDMLLVYFVAAEEAGRLKLSDAQLKAQKAGNRLKRITAAYQNRDEKIVLGRLQNVPWKKRRIIPIAQPIATAS